MIKTFKRCAWSGVLLSVILIAVTLALWHLATPRHVALPLPAPPWSEQFCNSPTIEDTCRATVR